MLSEDNILTISDFDEGWVMRLDLNVLVNEVGKMTAADRWQDPRTGVWYYDPPHVKFPLPKARQALKLILTYGYMYDNDEERSRIDELFQQNPKLNKAWKEEKQRRKVS